MPSASAPSGADLRIGHVPALDGLRGAAVAAVLVYHGGFGWAGGGFLGVSTFFTLSGFLITMVLLAGRDRGHVALGSFYLRRVRRLLPASLLTLLLVLAYGIVVAGPSERQGLGGDALATLGQVANWRFVLEGRSYGDLFSAPSPLQHVWSLAIEEQFYLVLPPLVALCVRWRWSLRRMTAVAAGLAGASLLATIALHQAGASTDRLYFGTDTRAVELLVGVLLALVVARTGTPTGSSAGRLAGLGALGLVATVVAWGVVEQSSPVLYQGGLALYAVASVAVVAGCLVPGPVAQVLSVAPLRRLGEISYGVYLLHWPVFRWLSPERLGVSRPVAFALGVAVSVSLATLSYLLLEQPIRERGRAPRTGSRPASLLPLAGAAAAGLVIVGSVLVPSSPEVIDVERTLAELRERAAEVEPVAGAPVVGVFGDSTATATSLGLAEWASGTGRIDFGPGDTELGCGIVVVGETRYGTGEGDMERCEDKTAAYAEAGTEIDLALVQFGPWDVADHRLPGDDRWRTVGDPVYDDVLRDEALRLIDIVTAEGAVVLWVQPPQIELGTVDGRPPADRFPTSEPARMRRFREIGEELRAARPDSVRLVDLAGWMADLPGGELDPTLRPDGVHFSDETALVVAEEFLGPVILDAWDDLRRQRGS